MKIKILLALASFTLLFSSSSIQAADEIEKIGVKSCDDYISWYNSCVNSKVPEASRNQLTQTLKLMASEWKKAISDAGAQKDNVIKSLDMGCQQAATTGKASLKPYGCE